MLAKVLVILLLAAGTQSVVAQQREPGDPLYPQQWHLNNTGQSGGIADEDINVEPVWNTTLTNGVKIRGQGVYISIVDGDMQLDHTDLRENVSTTRTHDYYPGITDNSSHATSVAGIAAARGYNSMGVRGVAPWATIYSLNLLADIRQRPGGGSFSFITNDDLMNAMQRNHIITAASNNSWGPENPFASVSGSWAMAINTGLANGFYGKGTIYVWAAGNNHCPVVAIDAMTRREVCGGDNANYDNYANYHAVVTVCAVDHKGEHNGSSEFGANLWVCAPSRRSGSSGRDGIVTTLTRNFYTTGFGGTSASTPMVSGVVALMRQANPSLSWRDVKLILANSARQNDPGDSDWARGAIKHGSFNDGSGERYHFNHKYGFGVVDADKAVEMARSWINVPGRITRTVTNNSPLVDNTISRNISVQSDINFTEYVDARIRLRTSRYSDLSVKLISPSGAISELAIPAASDFSSGFFSSASFRPWRFGSAKHLGEDPSGVWRLEIDNIRATEDIVLFSSELRIRGYQIKMDAVPVAELSNTNLAETPLILSLIGAKWAEDLQPSDFNLKNLRPSDPQFKNTPAGLRIASVNRTSDTQVRLELALTGDLLENYLFQVEATTGTVSSLGGPLAGNDIPIVSNTRITVRKDIVLNDATVNRNYRFSLDDIFASAQALTYTVSGLPPGLEINGSIIGGTPSIAGDYRIEVVATRADGVSRTEFFDLQIPLAFQVQLRVLLEGALATFIDVCDRTEQVRNIIVSSIGSSDCAAVPQHLLRSVADIGLSNSGISSLATNDFDDFTGLETLNLSANSLTDLPEDVFRDLTSLRTLNLSNNDLTTLTAVIFNGLPSLETLNLSANELTDLPEDVFRGLTNLRTLNLSNNDLTLLPTTIFGSLTNLRTLNLSNNRLSVSLSDPRLSANNNELFNRTFNRKTFGIGRYITMLHLSGNGIASADCTTLRDSFPTFTRAGFIISSANFSCS